MLRHRTHLLVALLLVFFSSPAFAQPDPSRPWEVFAGYSILRTHYDPEVPGLGLGIVFFDGHQSLNGLNVSLTKYLAGQLALTGDASWHSTTDRVPDPVGGSIATTVRIASISGGPQFQLRTHTRFTPFLHGLAGVTQTWARLDVPVLDARETRSSTDFAVTIGGGADVRLGDRISVRVFEGDYSRIFLPRGNGFGFAPRPHNVRLSFGVVMK